MLTNKEIKEIKENYPSAKIKYMSSYGKEINHKENLCLIAAKFNPRKNELIFMADARKLKQKGIKCLK